MSLAVLYVDDRGEAAIDAYAIMESAIDLYFKLNDPADIDIDKVTAGIEKAHSSLLSVAATLLSRNPSAESLRPRPNITAVVDNVIEADFTPPARQIPVSVPRETGPVVAEALSQTLELPFEAVPVSEVAVPISRSPIKGRSRKVSPSTPVAAPTAKETALLRRRSDTAPKSPRLPKRLSKIEDALRMDKIICLEDGKAVVDLGKHLASIGISQPDYLSKWGLPETYPMKAPNLILKHGVTYEYDASRDRMIRV